MAEAPEVAGVVELGIKAAEAYGRPDLAARLSALRERLSRSDIHVFIIGDYKMGKSTMVNALIGSTVCPVDDGISTTVPTLVRHAPEPTARAIYPPTAPDGDPVSEEIPFGELADYVSEAGNPANKRGIRMVEIGLPQPVLAGGLVVVDTPGVGGLASPESAATMAAATAADAVIFATSAAQELTAPEMELLETVAVSCPHVVIVLTKTDMYPAWRQIAELDRSHLAARKFDARVIPISSELRIQALRYGDAAEFATVEPEYAASRASGRNGDGHRHCIANPARRRLIHSLIRAHRLLSAANGTGRCSLCTGRRPPRRTRLSAPLAREFPT